MASYSEFEQSCGGADITIECVVGGWIVRTHEPNTTTDLDDDDSEWSVTPRVFSTMQGVLDYLERELPILQARLGALNMMRMHPDSNDDQDHPGTGIHVSG